MLEEDEKPPNRRNNRTPPPSAVASTKKRSRPRSRKSNAASSAANSNVPTNTSSLFVGGDAFDDTVGVGVGVGGVGNTIDGSFERSGPVYSEKGYDPNELPLRERFTFSPEYELDGSSKIDCIVGRRIKQTKRAIGHDLSDDDNEEQQEDTTTNINNGEGGQEEKQKTRKAKEAAAKAAAESSGLGHVEYEYLIKYKGVSYLHLEWKAGNELESMNKSAKTIYRRFLKKLDAGNEEGLEDPEFDQSFIQPQKIVDEQEHEIEVEMTDAEFIQWEKDEKQRRLEEGEDVDDDGADEKPVRKPLLEEQEEKKEGTKLDLLFIFINIHVSNFQFFKIKYSISKSNYFKIQKQNKPFRTRRPTQTATNSTKSARSS